MPVFNPRNARQSVTRKVNQCDGCGRLLPKGSAVTIWQVWLDGMRERFRFCTDCQGVIYGCSSRDGSRRPLNVSEDSRGYICREVCETCDSFPLCGKANHLKADAPGDVYFGDLGN